MVAAALNVGFAGVPGTGRVATLVCRPLEQKANAVGHQPGNFHWDGTK
jgi:hypothetical protein